MNEGKRRRALIIVISITLVLLVIVGVGIWAGYTYHNDWTGFQDYQPGTPEAERGKTLWDWMELLIIPAVLAVGALWVNWISQRNEQRRADRENQIEREIASERNQEAALQNYLDKMTELLLTEDLRISEPEAEVRTVARTRTLTVLRGLDKERKTSVVRFLIETGLISSETTEKKAPIISLERADLSEADLPIANLRGADLRRTDLCRANLGRADLRGANLLIADLRGANLRLADLTGADLSAADLTGANLTETDLRGADLRGAMLPNGFRWCPGYDMWMFDVRYGPEDEVVEHGE